MVFAMKSIDIALPVYNEENLLKKNFNTIHNFFKKRLHNYSWQIVIVNNGSIDNTDKVISDLIKQFPRVKHLFINKSGKGRALRKIFTESTADIILYTDIDLSADLRFSINLLDKITQGYDIANSSRFNQASKTKRKFHRKILGFCVRKIVNILFNSKVTDYGCGMKALKRESASQIAKFVKNNKWFFETEFMLIAEKLGYKINETPVAWEEGRESKMKLVATTLETISSILRLAIKKPWKNLIKKQAIFS